MWNSIRRRLQQSADENESAAEHDVLPATESIAREEAEDRAENAFPECMWTRLGLGGWCPAD